MTPLDTLKLAVLIYLINIPLAWLFAIVGYALAAVLTISLGTIAILWLALV